jgi:hypothetical protein
MNEYMNVCVQGLGLIDRSEDRSKGLPGGEGETTHEPASPEDPSLSSTISMQHCDASLAIEQRSHGEAPGVSETLEDWGWLAQ